MQISLDVFSRDGNHTIDERPFYALLAGLIGGGLLLNVLITGFLMTMNLSAWLIIPALLLAIGAIVLASYSESSFGSLVGYIVLVICMSTILGIGLHGKALPIIRNAALITLGVTGIMAAAGVIFPGFFESIGGALFSALVALVIIRIIALFWPALAHLRIIDYLAAGIFSLYIGFDMWRASTIAHTFKNAIDVALNIYLDILNVFVNLVSILSEE